MSASSPARPRDPSPTAVRAGLERVHFARDYGGLLPPERKDTMRPQTVIVIIAVATIVVIAWRLERHRRD